MNPFPGSESTPAYANQDVRRDWRRSVLLVVAVVFVTTVAAGAGLWALAGAATPEVRLDVVRTALAIGGGTGALITLLYAVRRQLLAETVADDNKLDATERRITELYVKGVEQLGSANATVRFGGLFALERLAEDSPRLRGTVVDVVCAYLRCAPLEDDDVTRTAAQKLLLDHLAFNSKHGYHKTHWPIAMIILSGATLQNFCFMAAQVDTAHFFQCLFKGEAQFQDAVIRGANFSETTFEGAASFANSRLQKAIFREARFVASVNFDGAQFAQGADFTGAIFSSALSFSGARISQKFASRTVLPAGWRLADEDDLSYGGAASGIGAWLPIERVV